MAVMRQMETAEVARWQQQDETTQMRARLVQPATTERGAVDTLVQGRKQKHKHDCITRKYHDPPGLRYDRNRTRTSQEHAGVQCELLETGAVAASSKVARFSHDRKCISARPLCG
jgi:hypothetical protein